MASREVSSSLTLPIIGVVTTLLAVAVTLGYQSIRSRRKTEISTTNTKSAQKKEIAVEKFLTKQDQTVILSKKQQITHDTYILRFSLPHPQMALGLPIGKHIRFTCPNRPGKVEKHWNGLKDSEGGATVSRKYTPVSANDILGVFDVLVKVYKPLPPKFDDGGKMSLFFDEMKVGDSIAVSGPFGSTEYIGEGQFIHHKNLIKGIKKINLIAGGSGITPMYQILTYILEREQSQEQLEFRLLFANQTRHDILLYQNLMQLEQKHPNLRIWFTIDKDCSHDCSLCSHNGTPSTPISPSTPGIYGEWPYGVGYITEKMLSEHLFPSAEDTLVLICGPPPMIQFACLPNLEKLQFEKKHIIVY